MRLFKRILALFLCLCILPATVLSEGVGTLFHLSFDMNAQAYPEEVRDVLSGIADLVNAITFEGDYQLEDGYFNANVEMLVNDAERTRTPIRIYGDKANWIFRSPLLGDETVFFYMDAFLEFAMKGYAHMAIPAQRVATLLTPYVHTHGLSEITTAAAPVLFAQEGSRVIPVSALKEMAEAVALAGKGRPYRYWVASLGRENGYEYDMRDLMETMPEWLESFVAEDGIRVDVTDTTETWSTGDFILCERTFSLQDAQTFKMTLPASPSGYIITAEAAFQQDQDLLHGSIDLLITDVWETEVLRIHTDGSLPITFPITRGFSLTWDAEGIAVGDEGIHLYFEGEGSGDTVILRQMTPDKEQTMFTLTFSELHAIDAHVEPYTDRGLSLVSVTSDSLAELVRAVALPMVKGILPILAEVPASACQSILDLLEESGIFGLLTGGLSGGDSWEEDEWSEDEWDEDEWSEEDWDDEDWSDEDWDEWSDDENLW